MKIEASTIDEFSNIEKELSQLPDLVKNQIEIAKNGIGTDCTFKDYFGEANIYLPKSVTQIKYFGDYIGIYCDNFFFRLKNKKIDYNFIFLKD